LLIGLLKKINLLSGLLKKKKTVTDIKFLDETEIKDDVLAWNCFSINKYNKERKSDK